MPVNREVGRPLAIRVILYLVLRSFMGEGPSMKILVALPFGILGIEYISGTALYIYAMPLKYVGAEVLNVNVNILFPVPDNAAVFNSELGSYKSIAVALNEVAVAAFSLILMNLTVEVIVIPGTPVAPVAPVAPRPLAPVAPVSPPPPLGVTHAVA